MSDLSLTPGWQSKVVAGQHPTRRARSPLSVVASHPPLPGGLLARLDAGSGAIQEAQTYHGASAPPRSGMAVRGQARTPAGWRKTERDRADFGWTVSQTGTR